MIIFTFLFLMVPLHKKKPNTEKINKRYTPLYDICHVLIKLYTPII